MSNKYNFQTNYFGTSIEGIHLLRNGFNFKTYPFHEVRELTIKQGHAVKNWLLLLVLGIGSLLLGGYYAWRTYLFFTQEGGEYYIEEVILQLVILAFGISCTYAALKKSLIIAITLTNKRDHYSIQEIEKQGNLNGFIDFLKQQLGNSRVVVDRR